MKKKTVFIALLSLLVAMMAIAIYTTTDYFPLRIKAVERYSIEKILFLGSGPAIDKVFDFIEEMEDRPGYKNRDVHAMFLHPSYAATLVRQEFFFQNIKPGFKDDRDKYWGVAYGSWTMDTSYHWNYYTNNAPQKMYMVMNSARQHILTVGKEYFSDPANLDGFVREKFPHIMARYHNSSPQTRLALKNILLEVATYDGAPKNDYTGEFLERRRAEGGDELVACYQDIASNLLVHMP